MRINRVALITEMARKYMTIKELSEKTGLSRATISTVKSGKGCSEETAAKLAAVLGQSIIEQEN
jgi:DNA-binding Xre family transcriptional regulator